MLKDNRQPLSPQPMASEGSRPNPKELGHVVLLYSNLRRVSARDFEGKRSPCGSLILVRWLEPLWEWLPFLLSFECFIDESSLLEGSIRDVVMGDLGMESASVGANCFETIHDVAAVARLQFMLRRSCTRDVSIDFALGESWPDLTIWRRRASTVRLDTRVTGIKTCEAAPWTGVLRVVPTSAGTKRNCLLHL